MQIRHQVVQRRRYWLKFRIKIYVTLFLLIGVGLALSYLLRETGIVRIQKLEITGLETNEEKEFLLAELRPIIFRNKIARFLGEDNYFSWPEAIDLQSLEFADLVISKNFLRREITVEVEKREKMGIWCALECWWFDKEGMLLESAPDSSGQLIFKINEGLAALTPGQRILPEPLFTNLKNILAVAKKLALTVKEFSYERSRQELKAVTDGGAEILFSLRFDPNLNVLGALTELLKKTPLTSIRYLDLTVENKIYLRPR